MRIILLFFLLYLTGCSCSKEELLWGQTELWRTAQKADPNAELVFLADTPEGRARRILCKNYRQEGCIPGTGKRVKVRLVEAILLQYERPIHACKAALEIGQWYSRNYLFDDVTNEPVLEDFAVKVFDAKKPETVEDCENL